jgi:hypothetical protein
MQKLQRFNVGIGAILAVLILFIGFRLSLPEGWARAVPVLLAALVFYLCAWAWKPKPPTTLNSFALPALAATQLPIGYLLVGIGLLALAYVAKAAVALVKGGRGGVFQAYYRLFRIK